MSRNQIALNTPIKTIGQHKVPISLHPEIETSITVIVARNNDEAARIERGEDVTQLREEPTRRGSRGACRGGVLRARGRGIAARHAKARNGRNSSCRRQELIATTAGSDSSVRNIVARNV